MQAANLQVEKLRFENNLLKDVIENHKKTISVLESQVKDHEASMQAHMKEAKNDRRHEKINEKHFAMLVDQVKSIKNDTHGLQALLANALNNNRFF